MQSEEEKLWDTISKFIRLRDSDENGIVQCVTCPSRFHWKLVHAGHFIGRRQKNTKFNERNLAGQCVSCNSFHGGRQFEFGLAIDKRYGEGTAEELLALSKVTCKLSGYEYREMNNEYKVKVKQLLKRL